MHHSFSELPRFWELKTSIPKGDLQKNATATWWKLPWSRYTTTLRCTKQNVVFSRRIWVREPLQKEKKIRLNCSLYRSTLPVVPKPKHPKRCYNTFIETRVLTESTGTREWVRQSPALSAFGTVSEQYIDVNVPAFKRDCPVPFHTRLLLPQMCYLPIYLSMEILFRLCRWLSVLCRYSILRIFPQNTAHIEENNTFKRQTIGK